MKLYKVLKHIDGKLFSPFQGHEYEPGREYICGFDPNRRGLSRVLPQGLTVIYSSVTCLAMKYGGEVSGKSES